MLINWDAGHPQGGTTPGQEVASINGLLSALAERRMKAEQVAQQQALAERTFAAQQANILHDNTLADTDLEFRRGQQTDLNHHWQAAEVARQAEETLRKRGAMSGALAQAEKWAETDPPRARRILEEAGYTLAPPPASPPGAPAMASAPGAPPPANSPPQGRAAIEPPPFQDPTTIGGPQVPSAAPPGRAPGMPGLPPAGPASAPAPSPGGPPPGGPPPVGGAPSGAPAAAPSRYLSPVGSVLDFDTNAIGASRKAQRKAAADAWRTELAATSKGPFAKQAITEIYGNMLSPTWDPEKEDPYRLFAARQHELEVGAQSERNARIARSGADDNKDRIRNQQAWRLLEAKNKQFDSIENMRQLGMEYDHVKQAAEKLNGPAPSQRAAIDGFVASAKRGTVTARSLDYIAGNMSGGMGQLQTLLSRFISGKYGDNDVAAMAEAIKIGEHAMRQDVERKRTAYVDEMYSPELYEVQGNVDSQYNARFVPFGYPPITREGNTPAISVTGGRIMSPGRGAGAKKPAAEDPKLKMLKALQDELKASNEEVKRVGGGR